MDNLVSYILQYPNSQQLIFNKNMAKFAPVRIKKVIFQLVTFEILKVVYSTNHKCVIFQLAR